jgi:drug/metabolite transporter (DMT)-like permease
VNGARDAGAWGRLMLLGMIWGGSFIAVAVALRDFGPVTVAFGRIAIAAAALTLWALVSGAGLPNPLRPGGGRIWAFAAALALLSNAGPFALLSWGQQHVPASLAAVFMALLPLVVLPLSHLFIPGEVLTPRKALGFALGSAGVVILIGPEALTGLAGGGAALLGELACVGVVVLYALGSITAKRGPAADPVGYSALVMLLAALMIAPAAFLLEAPLAARPALQGVGALVWLGLLSTALGQVLLIQVLWRAGPPFLSQVNFLIPIWAMIFGVTLLGESVAPRTVVALALIFVGVAVAQGLIGRSRALTRAPSPR